MLGDSPARKIAEWHKELGPIVRVKMGVEDWIYVADAGMAHDLFTSEDSLTSSSPHFMCEDAIYSGKKGYVCSSRLYKSVLTLILREKKTHHV